MADSILVVVEQREGKLNRVSWETLTAGQALAAETGWTLEAAVAGSGVANFANEIAAKKVAKVYAIESAKLEPYTPDAFAAALQAIHRVQTAQAGADAAHLPGARLRAQAGHRHGAHRHQRLHRLQERRRQTALHAPDVSGQTGRRRQLHLRCALVRDLPERSLSRRQGGSRRSAAPVETVNVEIADGVIRNQPQEVFKEAKQAVDLTQAEIIVSVGRGIKEQKNIELAKQLAEALGGELAASRPICDSGWLPMDRQIGSSGQTVAPKLYLALGISGAIQHIVGMKGARTIIAVNKDSEAPIFEIADYAVVGNLFDIVPPLIEEVKKAKAGG